MALPGLTSPNLGAPVDPDSLPACSSCLHAAAEHNQYGWCTVRDDLGNYCACAQEGL
jgi:hypothetical protein